MTAVKIESESSNNRGVALPIGLLFTPSRWEGPLALIRGLHGIYYWCRYPGYRLGVFTNTIVLVLLLVSVPRVSLGVQRFNPPLQDPGAA